jgi:hypothetical protein
MAPVSPIDRLHSIDELATMELRNSPEVEEA